MCIRDRLGTEPIDVDDNNHDGYGTHELHDPVSYTHLIGNIITLYDSLKEPEAKDLVANAYGGINLFLKIIGEFRNHILAVHKPTRVIYIQERYICLLYTSIHSKVVNPGRKIRNRKYQCVWKKTERKKMCIRDSYCP